MYSMDVTETNITTYELTYEKYIWDFVWFKDKFSQTKIFNRNKKIFLASITAIIAQYNSLECPNAHQQYHVRSYGLNVNSDRDLFSRSVLLADYDRDVTWNRMHWCDQTCWTTRRFIEYSITLSFKPHASQFYVTWINEYYVSQQNSYFWYLGKWTQYYLI